MKKNLITKIIISLAIVAVIVFGGFALMPKAKAETPLPLDLEKSFLQAFALNGIKQYQKVNLTEGYVFIDGQGFYNVVCESNGTWLLISKMQLPATTPTPTP